MHRYYRDAKRPEIVRTLDCMRCGQQQRAGGDAPSKTIMILEEQCPRRISMLGTWASGVVDRREAMAW